MFEKLKTLFSNQIPVAEAGKETPTPAAVVGVIPERQPETVAPDLGNALLQAGPGARKAEVILPEPAPVVEIDDEHQLPRTPAQIRELLKTETPEQTQVRIRSDKIRYANLCTGDAVPTQAQQFQQDVEPPKADSPNVEVQQVSMPVKTEQRKITMSEQEQVLKFIQSGPADGTTALEIGGGTGLPRETVSEILAGVVASGEVIKIGDLNTAVYRAVQPSFVPVEPTVPFVSVEAKWNAEAQAHERAKMEAQRPKAEPDRIPKLDEIILPEPVKPLTEAERKEYEISHRNRRPIINPNAYLVR